MLNNLIEPSAVPSPNSHSPQDQALSELEVNLEAMMVDRGIERYRKLLSESQKDGASAFGGSASVMKSLVEPLSEAFAAFIQEAGERRGPKQISLDIITQASAEVTAYFTIKAVIDNAGKPTGVPRSQSGGRGVGSGFSISALSNTIADWLLDELKYRKFQSEAKGLFSWKMARFKTSNYDHRNKSLAAAVRSVGLDVSEFDRSPSERIAIGSQCLAVLLSALPQAFVKEEVWVSKNRSAIRISMSPELSEKINDLNFRMELLATDYLPLALPPIPWSTSGPGGYYFPPLRGKVNLVRHTSFKENKGRLGDLKNIEMPAVYASLNAIQNTSWAINDQVLEVMGQMAQWNTGVAGIPKAAPEELPKKPAWLEAEESPEARTEAQAAELKVWRKKSSLVHEGNLARLSKALHFKAVLSTARLIKKEYQIEGREIPFYFAWNLDFRGRVYPIAPKLNPQGSDISRGLLKFGIGKPLGSSGAVDWLAIHGANCLADSPQGEKLDKLPFEERIAWVNNHEKAILSVADNPLAETWWTTADSPFQFLAWVFEWAAFIRSGRSLEFMSSLPVSMDGSCNGLQHYSALLRDAKGGEAVNLCPSERPQDIYQRVANRVGEILKRDWSITDLVKMPQDALGDTGTPEEDRDGLLDDPEPKEGVSEEDSETAIAHSVSEYAAGWISWGKVNRKFVKRQVMTLPYGSRQFGFREQIAQFVQALKDSDRPSFAQNAYKDTVVDKGLKDFAFYSYMAGVIWEALGGVVESAQEGMDFFQGCAKVAAKSGMPISWVAPTGFPVVNAYYNMESRTIKTILNGKIVMRPTVQTASDKIDPRKQVSSISPNIIHSLDASALMLAITESAARGITHFLAVHDCFGTHACDAPELAKVTRSTFVSMYRDNDILGRLFEDLTVDVPEEFKEKLPAMPAVGDLDLEQVERSRYFFA